MKKSLVFSIKPIKFSKFFLLTALFMSLPVLLTAQNMDSAEGDRQALADLYNSTNGSQWNNNSGWLSGNPSNSWYGVEVNSGGRVVKLDLFKNNLSGTLPESIGNLTKVEFLNLKHNQLTGQIPASIGNLESVTHLLLAGVADTPDGNTDHYPDKSDWGGNTFTGYIPPQIGNLPNVEWIELSRNDFRDTELPSEIGNLTTLKGLYLNNNGFVGELPESWGNLVNLIDLQLYPGAPDYNYNDKFPDDTKQLTGTIPEVWGMMNSLERLRLREHQLTGGFPEGWKNNSNLSYFNVSINNFTEFPYFLNDGYFPSLSSFFIGKNNFEGVVPDVFKNMPNVRSVALNNNYFTGELPESIWELNLIALNIYGNNFEGTIPDDLSHMTFARNIRIQDNNFTGNLPTKLPNSKNLINLGFSGNNFEGQIPDAFAQIDNSGTSTNGPRTIFLGGNNLEGKVPDFSQLDGYTHLDLSNNKFIFEDLIPHRNAIAADIENFSYDPQKAFGTDIVQYSELGQKVTLQFESLTHPDNRYQWSKNGSVISGATSKTFEISSFSDTDTGDYTLQVTNSEIPELTIESSKITLKIGESSDDGGSGDGNTAPEAPSTISPADGSVNISQNPRFEWNSVDTDYYIVNVINAGSSVLVGDGEVTGTSMTLSEPLDFDTQYRWRIRGVKDGNEGDWSSYADFTTRQDDSGGNDNGSGDNTGDQVLQAPDILSPADGEENISLKPLLSWSDVEADYYILHLDSPELPGSYELILDEEVSGNSFSVNEALNPELRYTWRIRGVKEGVDGEWSPVAEFTTAAAVEENPVAETELAQNYPNPFNPSTQIRFTIGETQQVSLKVYDMAGRLVANLLDGSAITAGSHEVTFNANNLASGIYFYRFITESEIVTRKMTLMK